MVNQNHLYMGVCSDYNEKDPTVPKFVIWTKDREAMGMPGIARDLAGPGWVQGGDRGDGFNGHPYVIDLEGDMVYYQY